MPIYGPPNLWGLVAHNLITSNISDTNFRLHARVQNQSRYAEEIIPKLFNLLNEWTNKPYFQINYNQDQYMHVLALPDMTKNWHSLSTISIW